MTTSYEPWIQHDQVTGTFRDRESAERAYDTLLSRGYSKSDINIMMSDETRKRHFSAVRGTWEIGGRDGNRERGIASVGGTVGAIAGVLAVAGALAIPGLGIVLAGPVAVGLAGAGAAAGGLLGALIGAGVPADRAKLFQTDIENGGILVGVNPRSPDDAILLEKEWRAYRAVHVQH